MDSFFSGTCTHCHTPLCERHLLVNMALGYGDEEPSPTGHLTLCPPCLAQAEGTPLATLWPQTVAYVLGRACFAKPWKAFDPTPCPLKETNQCQC
jgi:hypothetical protein